MLGCQDLIKDVFFRSEIVQAREIFEERGEKQVYVCRLVDFSQEQNQILRLHTSFRQFQTWLLPGLFISVSFRGNQQ